MIEADQLLLTGIRRGDELAWSQLVRRYQGRLVAFATKQTSNPTDAEDAVQDCFVTFVKQLDNFRGAASLETFLFQILRHRIIDQHRKQVRRPCRLSSDLSDQQNASAAWRSADPTPSAYAQTREAQANHEDRLARALRTVTEHYQTQRDFDKLRTIEMLFYAQLCPSTIAEHTGINNNTIATIKRRTVQKIREALQADQSDTPLTDTLLTAAWEAARPSCPKRSTVGAYLLDSLDADWHAYVDFHLATLGCRFCTANLDDLKQQVIHAEADVHDDNLNNRILRSSIGFLPHNA